MTGSGLKSLTSPPNLTLKSVVSKRVMGAMPLCPASSPRQYSGTDRPSGLTVPSPVMTTRRRVMGGVTAPCLSLIAFSM